MEDLVQLFIEQIAKTCHEVNRVFCKSVSDFSQPSWENAPQWQKDSTINGVKFLMGSDVTPEQVHENWLKVKIEDGWVYGEVKDVEKKTHPCILPYNELPEFQRTKDALFKAVVDSFK